MTASSNFFIVYRLLNKGELFASFRRLIEMNHGDNFTSTKNKKEEETTICGYLIKSFFTILNIFAIISWKTVV
jgi:hypothetical protein